jgi:hypothetical protein
MAAAYLISPVQRALLARLRDLNRDEERFFVDAPLVIDCRNDAEISRSRLTATQHARIEKAIARGNLIYVSQLARPAYDYARNKLEEQYSQLDASGRHEVRSFLDDWRLEAGRRINQPRKSRPNAFGIDIHPADVWS